VLAKNDPEIDLSGEGPAYNPSNFVEQYVPVEEKASMESDVKPEQDIPIEPEVKPEQKSSLNL
jgi:large subunit ribosomal protein L47